MFVFLEEFRRADIGRQHAFFDQAMCFIARSGLDAIDLAVVVEDHDGFRGLELDRATLLALAKQ